MCTIYDDTDSDTDNDDNNTISNENKRVKIVN
jgi:hypothetical protein